MIAIPTPKSFRLGQVVATPGALEALEKAGQTAVKFLQQHSKGDWGDVCSEDWNLNDEALELGTRLLSAYTLKDRTKIWVITEADRSSTCVLLPGEY